MDNLLICIQNETAAMTNLIELLRQEQTALEQAPSLSLTEQINVITQNKNQLIATISQIGQLRNKELMRMGVTPTAASSLLPKWLQNREQKEAWTVLIKHTKKAKELNRVNGLLINKHLIRNQSTLQVLFQHHPASDIPVLYGADGQSNTKRATMRGLVA